MTRPAPDRSWRRALRDSVPWFLLALGLTAATGAGLHYYVLGGGGPPGVEAILIGSYYTAMFVFPVVAVAAGLSRRSWRIPLLVAGPWFCAWTVVAAVAVGYLLFFAKRITP